MLEAPTSLVAATSSEDLRAAREQAKSWRSPEITLADHVLTDAALIDLAETAVAVSDVSFRRAVSAIQSARAGDFPAVPGIGAATEMLHSFLTRDRIDGWLYVREPDGYLHPYLVMKLSLETADRTHGPRIKFTMEADNPTVKRPSRAPRILYFEETEIVGKSP
ncbi:AAA family ATPase, partial [Gordonia sp. HY442]|nr:AAA family ATPase [Gordonia zhenghanii]